MRNEKSNPIVQKNSNIPAQNSFLCTLFYPDQKVGKKKK